MVVRDSRSLEAVNCSRVPAAATALAQQTGSRPLHPPRALNAAEEGSEGNNAGGQAARWQGILHTRGWQPQPGVGVHCCREDRSWGG